MGNNHSATTKTASPTSPPQSSSTSAHASGHHQQSRNTIPIHTSHRSAAPPEPSLAEAQGSTASTKPKSIPSTALSSLSPSPHNSLSASHKATEPMPIHDEPSKPVDVPCEPSSFRGGKRPTYDYDDDTRFADPHMVSSNSVTDAYINRPPRLPLPIEEEVHTPGSPILGPEDDLPPAEPGDSSDGLTRKSSMVSADTVDDEDGSELRVDKTRPVVPVKIEWKRGGEKVYVTGTIFQWNRKQRLNPVEGKPGCYAGTIYILPGTHHVRFVVDGIMQTSPDLPTTVDFGNNLVNYIEVSPEEALKQTKAAPAAEMVPKQPTTKEEKQPKLPRGKAVLPPENYRQDIPQYLLDFDQAEDSPAYQTAVGAIEKLPTPPSLPGFLGKPILNAATLMKDDNSVLNMPNHTVLNHLATSSIKNNVLAVCATTRYHNKYVTTIIYKPTSADEG